VFTLESIDKDGNPVNPMPTPTALRRILESTSGLCAVTFSINVPKAVVSVLTDLACSKFDVASNSWVKESSAESAFENGDAVTVKCCAKSLGKYTIQEIY